MKLNIYSWLIWLFLVVFGVVAPTYLTFVNSIKSKPLVVDQRLIHLEQFSSKYKCPAPLYLQDYLKIADKYGLDYRLLPSIAFRESTCGKHQLYNNWFGIGSATALKHYKNVPAGIDAAGALIVHLEQNSSLTEALKRYGPSDNLNYSNGIYEIMEKIER